MQEISEVVRGFDMQSRRDIKKSCACGSASIEGLKSKSVDNQRVMRFLRRGVSVVVADVILRTYIDISMEHRKIFYDIVLID